MQHSLFDITTNYTADVFHADALLVQDAAGRLAPASDRDVLIAARKIADQVIPKRQPLDNPIRVKEFLRLKLNSTLEYEVFGMVLLDSQFCLIKYQEPFRGTLTQASVYPREIAKIALEANAAAIIIAHNHPSGALEPSEADKTLTQHLKKALELIDVRVLDHILVADNRTYSFAEHGVL